MSFQRFTVLLSLSTAICSTPDWLRLDNSCFKAFTEKVNWFTAQRACQIFNSSLTSIHTGKENDFIRQRVVSSNDSSAWIGLNNLRNNTKFEWTDGSHVSFTNWAPKEPNNAGGENCTELHVLTGNWNDLNCSSENRTYVCEKRWNQ